MTFQELIYASVTNAMRGLQPSASPNLDAMMIAQTLFPEVSQSVCEAAAANEYKRSLLRRTKTLTLVAGSATLTDDVLTHFIPDATFYDPSNLNKKYAWRDYPDFVRRGDRRLGIFSLQGGDTLVEIEPNAGFSVPLVATGARTLITPCVVEIPTLATDDVDAPDEILSDITEGLSNALRGEMSRIAGEAA